MISSSDFINDIMEDKRDEIDKNDNINGKKGIT